MVAAPFAAIISDRFGRRKGMFTGAVIIIVRPHHLNPLKFAGLKSLSLCRSVLSWQQHQSTSLK